jgi:hypothetical protein
MKLKKKIQIKKLTKEKKKEWSSIKYERRKKYKGEIEKQNKFRNYLKKIKRIKTISDRQNKLKEDANEKKTKLINELK